MVDSVGYAIAQGPKVPVKEKEIDILVPAPREIGERINKDTQGEIFEPRKLSPEEKQLQKEKVINLIRGWFGAQPIKLPGTTPKAGPGPTPGERRPIEPTPLDPTKVPKGSDLERDLEIQKNDKEIDKPVPEPMDLPPRAFGPLV